MRILMLSQWFDPEPTFKGLTFARELSRLGHEVEVLTGFPNYPGGKLYDSHRVEFLKRESLNGISVLRVPLYPSHNSSALERTANYGSFALSASIIGALAVKAADVMYVYHPPATVGLPAMLLNLFRRIPFVYDIHDLWPDTLAATGMFNSKIGLGIVEKWCSLVYRQASKIVVQSQGFKRFCANVASGKQTGSDLQLVRRRLHSTNGEKRETGRAIGMKDRFNVIFAGTMGKAQALDAVLDAAQSLKDSYKDIQFVFVGGGIEQGRLRQQAVDRRLHNVIFLSRRPVSQIGGILNLADVLLIHLKDDPLFSITIPGKTQAYLAVGRPILVGVRGDAADLVTKAGAGMACTPEDSDSISKSILTLYNLPRAKLEAMGQNGSRFYSEQLSARIGTLRFERILKQVAGAGCSNEAV